MWELQSLKMAAASGWICVGGGPPCICLGCLDIAISSYVKHRIGYYLNACNGRGDFYPVVIITTNALNSHAVRAADMDVRCYMGAGSSEARPDARWLRALRPHPW